MLRRTKEIARAAGEAVGVLTPSQNDATKAAEEHRQKLTAAQAALEQAQDALQAAHDRGADSELTRLEAAVAAAKVEVSRCEGRYLGAEKRLAAVRQAEHAERKAEAIKRRDAALEIQAEAAQDIDRLA